MFFRLKGKGGHHLWPKISQNGTCPVNSPKVNSPKLFFFFFSVMSERHVGEDPFGRRLFHHPINKVHELSDILTLVVDKNSLLDERNSASKL